MIREFFQQYADAFSRHDTEYISSVYSFPMTFYSESGEALVFEQAQFNDNSNNLIALYRNIGIENVSFNIKNESQLSKNVALVAIEWSFKNSEYNEIYSATTMYILSSSSSSIKILGVVVVDETTKLAELRNSNA